MEPETAYSKSFAEIYDIITGHKSYDLEVAALTDFLRERVGEGGLRLLDLGCGTGTHAIRLACEGFTVTGIDLSTDMISVATSKKSAVNFQAIDIEDLADRDFHCVTCLFNVVNCLSSYHELKKLLFEARKRMMAGGVIIVEAWNPVAVIADPPQVVCREYPYEGGIIRREVTPECDFMNQRLSLNYSIKMDGESAHEIEHPLFLFMPWEIVSAMNSVGFNNVEIRSALPTLAEAMSTDRMLSFVGIAGT